MSGKRTLATPRWPTVGHVAKEVVILATITAPVHGLSTRYATVDSTVDEGNEWRRGIRRVNDGALTDA